MSLWSSAWEIAGKILPSIGAASGPVADIGTAGGIALRVMQELIAQKVDLKDSVALANSIQQILVDIGVEPQPVFEAAKLAEAVAAAMLGAYSAGIITGGTPPSYPPGGGPGSYRGR